MESSSDASSSASSKRLSIIVIGGSLTGLMHGIILKRLGHDVRILEQTSNSDRRDLGAGITVGPQAQEYFRNHDVTKQPYSVPCPGAQILDAKSNVKRFLAMPMEMSSWSVLYYRLRANFDGLKSNLCQDPPDGLDYDGEAVYDTGKKVRTLSYVDGQVSVGFDDTIKGGSQSIQGDLVIAADGANSTVRQILLPNVQRAYSGYVAWRGCVPESELSQEARELLDPRCSAFICAGGYILCYIIPGGDGSLETGHRLVNWVWYFQCSDSSSGLAEIMTDRDGQRHRNFLPLGMAREEAWAKQKSHAEQMLSPPFKQLIRKTNHPGISVIHDYAPAQAAFYDNKLLLVGEALALFRPHMALSFNQSALDSLLLEKAMRGSIDLTTWERQVVQYGRQTHLKNVVMGNYFVFGGIPFVMSLVRYGLSLLPTWR